MHSLIRQGCPVFKSSRSRSAPSRNACTFGAFRFRSHSRDEALPPVISPRRSLRGLLLLPSPRRRPLPRTLLPSLLYRLRLPPSPVASTSPPVHCPLCRTPRRCPSSHPLPPRLLPVPPVGIACHPPPCGRNPPRSSSPTDHPTGSAVTHRTGPHDAAPAGPYGTVRRQPFPAIATTSARPSDDTHEQAPRGPKSLPMGFRAIDPPHGSRQLHGIHFADIDVPLFHF